MSENHDGRLTIRGIEDVISLEQRPFREFVKASSIYDLIKQASERHGEKDAFIYLPDGKPDTAAISVSYNELFSKVTQAANLFRSLGIGAEESVAILSPNMPEAHFALWGAETACRACPINFMLETEHILAIMEQAKVKAIVCLGHDNDLPILSKVTEISERTGLRDIFTIGEDAEFQSFTKALNVQPETECVFDIMPEHDTVAALFHTGGTTGTPKLAQHSHGNQLYSSYCAALYYAMTAEDVVINGFPVFHVAGTLVYGTSCFTAGATQILITRTGYRNRDLMSNIWRHVARHRVTIFSCVPTVLTTLLQTDTEGCDLTSLRAFYTGGSPLPTELANEVEQKLSVPVRNIFGMTECAGLLALEPFYALRTPGAAGYRLPYSEIKAFATDDAGLLNFDAPREAGQAGVLAIRGPNVGPGYTEKHRNAGAFENGWLISGDIGTVDENGKVFVTGREKDVIIRGAHNIDPASIEEAVGRHPAIANCAAVGQPDSYAGEIPVVYAELKVGMEATPEEVLEFAIPLIPEPAARPKRIEFVDELPKTPVGKIFKPQIRCRATDYAFKASLSETNFEGKVKSVIEDGEIVVQVISGNKTTNEQKDAYRKALQNYALKYQFIENS